MDNKRLKDPIYGYIEIPKNYMEEIVDTAVFQRLRRVIQTSYSPLYASAVHNRFVHSLGVYHLGEIAVESLCREIIKKNIYKDYLEIQKIKEIFLAACLLHDVGHAPFSHTGEEFYKDENLSVQRLHERLIEVIGQDGIEKEQLEKDFLEKLKKDGAAPHEIMSAIVGLKEFYRLKCFENAADREFFARCITGYTYSYAEGRRKKEIQNCIIGMLNGKIIDVDKLDYLKRDAYITGFDTVNIDYERLLMAITIVKEEGKYELAYGKSAVSIIENVAYAHDAERKWIQNHPVVLYESYLIHHMIACLNEKLATDGRTLLSEESLSVEGHKLKNIRISLLSDDDIIHLFKNVYHDELGMEFFERRKRRHPVWKSEAEYDAYFNELIPGGKIRDDFDQIMKNLAGYLTKSTDTCVVNNALLRKLKKDVKDVDAIDETKEEDENYAESIRLQKKTKSGMLQMVKNLKKYADEKGLLFDFVVVKASQFESNFGKDDFEKIKIVFPSLKEGDDDYIVRFGDVASPLHGNERKRDHFFYLFYNKKLKKGAKGDADIDLREFSRYLMLNSGQ